MKRRGIDLFHGTDFSVPYVHARPSVLTLHDLSPWMNPDWHGGARRVRTRTPRLLRWKLADFVITPSEAVRQQAIARFQLAPERVVPIPLAAGDLFGPLPSAPAGRPYFVFVGTIEPRKNVARLIEAWRTVRAEADLVIAGRVRSDADAPKPEPGLRLLGAVPDAELPKLYTGALACVYPSLYEGFGLPVLEAMKCGALVVTSRDPAILEVTGGSAVHTDAETLAEALGEIVRNPEKFQGLREAALQRAGQFSWRRTACLTREVYEAALRLRRGSFDPA
jgi:alpha-1,3-rhamnosyl/mannosyltransferase